MIIDFWIRLLQIELGAPDIAYQLFTACYVLTKLSDYGTVNSEVA